MAATKCDDQNVIFKKNFVAHVSTLAYGNGLNDDKINEPVSYDLDRDDLSSPVVKIRLSNEQVSDTETKHGTDVSDNEVDASTNEDEQDSGYIDDSIMNAAAEDEDDDNDQGSEGDDKNSAGDITNFADCDKDVHNNDDDDAYLRCPEETKETHLSSLTSSPNFPKDSSSEILTPPLTLMSTRNLIPVYSVDSSTSTESSTPSTPKYLLTPIPPSILPTASTPLTPPVPSRSIRQCRIRTLLSTKPKSNDPDQETAKCDQSVKHLPQRISSYADFNNNSFHLTKKSHGQGRKNEASSEAAITEILHEAVHHQNILVQASQALNIADLFAIAGKNSASAVIEAERILLLESERRKSCLEEVKRLKERSLKESPPHGTAKISLTDMKIIVCGPGTSAFINRSGKSLNLVLLANAGYGNITITDVVSNGWSSSTDSFTIPLTDIKLHTLQHDFQLSLKLFAMWTNQDSREIHSNNSCLSYSTDKSISSITINHSKSMFKIKEKVIDHNISGILFKKKNKGSPEKNIVAKQSNKQPLFRKSSFMLLGAATLNLDSVRQGKRHEIEIPYHECTIELAFTASLTPKSDVNICGILSFKEDAGGVPQWNTRWCRIDGDFVKYWRECEDDNKKEPLGIIDLRQCVGGTVTLLPSIVCARPHTIEIMVRRMREAGDRSSLMTVVQEGETLITYWICCDDEEKCSAWFTAINKQLSNYMAWK